MASRVSVGPSPERITPNEMAVVELLERISSSGNLCFASSLVNGVRGHARIVRDAAGVEANALGEDEEHVATHGGGRGEDGEVRRMTNPGLDVPRGASRVMTEEPAHRVKPNDVGGGRLCGTKRARHDEREPQADRRHQRRDTRGRFALRASICERRSRWP